MFDLKKQLRLVGSIFIILSGIWLYYQSQAVSLPELPAGPDIKIPVLKEKISTEKITYPELQAPIALVYAPRSQTILFEKNPDMQWSPASTTKLVTALVVLENYSLDTLITIDGGDLKLSEKAVFQIGEELTVKDLLEAMLVSSSNQAAYILANHSPGGLDQFVEKMNQFAAKNGLETAQFRNPAGFDAPGQHVTASDLIKLAGIVMANPTLRKMVALTEVEIADFTGNNHHNFHTTNQLLLEEVKVIGIKTGTTGQAGQVLLSQFKLDEEDLVVVVMGSKDRYADTKAIVNWVLESYDWLSTKQLEALVKIDLDQK